MEPECASSDSQEPSEVDPKKAQLLLWRTGLMELWMSKAKGPPLHDYLRDKIFPIADNAYETTLELIRMAPDYSQAKNTSLAGTILSEFGSWIQSEPGEEKKFADFVTEDIQIRAFSVATANHTSFLELIVKIYKLTDIAEKFLPEIRTMVEKQHFKDAANAVALLKLQKHFNLYDIVIPCLLTDKLSSVELYLLKQQDLQVEFAKILDNLIWKNTDRLEALVSEYPNLQGIRKEKFEGKTVQKLVARLVKLYNIPAEVVPNLTRTRSEGGLRYLVFKRYQEKTLNDDNWEDLVSDGIKACPELATYFVSVLSNTTDDLEEAAKWAKRFKLSREEIPGNLIDFMTANPFAGTTDNGPEETSFKFHENDEFLYLPEEVYETTIIISEKTQLFDEIEKLKKNSTMETEKNSEGDQVTLLGLDSEWRPSFGNNKEKIAILQIATWTKILLIRIEELEKEMTKEEWHDFFRKVFCDASFRKIGFGFDGDLQTLLSSIPCLKEVSSEISNFIDLTLLVRKLRMQNVEISRGLKGGVTEANVPTASGGASELTETQIHEEAESEDKITEDSAPPTEIVHFSFGLTDLARVFLGKALDKTEQFSNWSRWPLRQSQMHYAGLDAYCQLGIYKLLHERSKDLEIDWERTILQSLIGPPQDKSATKGMGSLGGKGAKKSAATKWVERTELMEMMKQVQEAALKEKRTQWKRPGLVKVVCDEMLQGLGKHLRRVGVDALILDNQDTRETLIQLAKTQQRIILTAGGAYMAIASRVPKELVVCLPHLSGGKEQLRWALTHLKIDVHEEDLFSRCLICNCGRYIFVPSPHLRVIWDSVIAPKDPFDPKPFIRSVAEQQLVDAKQQYDDLGESLSAKEILRVGNRWIFGFEGGSIDLIRGSIIPDEAEEIEPAVPESAGGSETNAEEHVGRSERAIADQEKEVDSKEESEEEEVKRNKETRVGIFRIPSHKIMEENSVFYICFSCGKIYWDGSHFNRFKSGIEGSLPENSPAQSSTNKKDNSDDEIIVEFVE